MIARLSRLLRVVERSDRDRGSSTLIIAIIGGAVLVFMAFACIDIASIGYMKNQQNSQAQDAAEAGAAVLTPTGSLSSASALRVAEQYLERRHGDGSAVWRNSSNPLAPKAVGNGPCSTRLINGAKVQVPYIVVKLARKRALGTTAEVTYTYRNGQWVGGVDASGLPLPVANRAVVYNVANVTVYDTATTTMMANFGKPCQNLTSTVSATTFGSNEDLAR